MRMGSEPVGVMSVVVVVVRTAHCTASLSLMHALLPCAAAAAAVYRYRTICRCIVVVPSDGSALFTDADGNLLRYSPDADTVTVASPGLFRRDYFGQYDPSSPGTMGYNWRQAVWVPKHNAVFGVHGNSG